MQYKVPRGTQDILPGEQRYWRYITNTAADLARKFGYQRVDTPILEQSGLFTRSIGEGTDIVEKETYTFLDRGGEELTLRAEGTAPVCRAYLEHGMHTLPQPVRLFYFAPIFRYERPQSGRYRQHHQFGVEAIGDQHPAIDAEVVELAWELLKALGLQDLALITNSIGCVNCRAKYLTALKDYFLEYTKNEQLCPDCRLRYQRNILRMLDCKRTDFACQPLSDGSPTSVEYLCADCKNHWTEFQGHLISLGIPFRVSHRLVRGLDYYTRTVFEIQPVGSGGAQSTVLAGGRYDGLIEEIGGKNIPGIGFGCGLERLILNLKSQQTPIASEAGLDVVVVTLPGTSSDSSLQIAAHLRTNGLAVLVAPSHRSLRGQLRFATTSGTKYTVIIGQNELDSGTVQVKNMTTGEQQEN